MDYNVPYMNTVQKLHAMLDAVSRAGVPEVFNKDFLEDLGFKSSYDRSLIKVLRYIGLLDSSNRPQDSYRQFVDSTKSRIVLAERLRVAFDDLFRADREAHSKTSSQLTGWFKTKTGSGEAMAKKIASTFKSLAEYADFTTRPDKQPSVPEPDPQQSQDNEGDMGRRNEHGRSIDFGLVNRFEIHLPDTQNVETFRAIFRALREELMP